MHWMQASRFTAIAGCETSRAGCARGAKRGLPTFSFRAHWSSSELGAYASAGMSDSSNSSTNFWLATARALSVVTSMPSLGARQHDGARARSPLISTTQARQLPSGRRPSM